MAYKTVTPKQVVEGFQKALDEKWGYIYGHSHTKWTQALQDKTEDSMAKKYGSQWIGHWVTDCSGIFAYWFKKLGSKMYHGSNTMWDDYTVAKGKLIGGQREDGQPLKPCTAVFKMRVVTNDGKEDYYHVGLWDGEKVIEAKGTRYGVTTSKLKEWTHWAELKYVNYGGEDNMADKIQYPTLREGDRGEMVTMLQDILSKNGSSLKVDGIFGAGTRSAVRAFQKKHDLDVDGVVGPKTWNALLMTQGVVEEEPEVQPDEDFMDSFTTEQKVAIIWAMLEDDLRKFIEANGVG